MSAFAISITEILNFITVDSRASGNRPIDSHEKCVNNTNFCIGARRDGRDSAQCVGTGVLIRKEALQANHGFTCGSITEDFDTAMALHAKGYKTVYINQVCADTSLHRIRNRWVPE